jgi:hypothetical protein
MKKIALEGSINKCSDSECIDWRIEVIAKLKNKYCFHNPMDFDCRGKEAELESQLVAFDTVGIASSDIVLVMANKPSWGTAMAIQMAWAQHKFILTVCADEKPSPWLKNRSNVLLKDLRIAVQYLDDWEPNV